MALLLELREAVRGGAPLREPIGLRLDDEGRLVEVATDHAAGAWLMARPDLPAGWSRVEGAAGDVAISADLAAQLDITCRSAWASAAWS